MIVLRLVQRFPSVFNKLNYLEHKMLEIIKLKGPKSRNNLVRQMLISDEGYRFRDLEYFMMIEKLKPFFCEGDLPKLNVLGVLILNGDIDLKNVLHAVYYLGGTKTDISDISWQWNGKRMIQG